MLMHPVFNKETLPYLRITLTGADNDPCRLASGVLMGEMPVIYYINQETA